MAKKHGNDNADSGTTTAQDSAQKVKTIPAKPKRKITIKEVFGAVKGNKDMMAKIMAADGASVPMMDVFGIAVRGKPGESALGEYIRFTGQFKAINLDTGEVFASSACILPNFLADDIHGAMMAAGDGVRNAQFAFRIGAHYDATSLTQYVYDATPLIAPEESDALTLLESQVRGAAQKLLEAKA